MSDQPRPRRQDPFPEKLLDGLDLDLPPARREARTRPPKTPSAFPRTGLYQGSPPRRPPSPPRRPPSPPRRPPSPPKPPKKRRGIGYGWAIALVIAALVLGGAGYVAYLEYLNGPQTTPLVALLYITSSPTPTRSPPTPTAVPGSTSVPPVSKSRETLLVSLAVPLPTATPTPRVTPVPPPFGPRSLSMAQAPKELLPRPKPDPDVPYPAVSDSNPGLDRDGDGRHEHACPDQHTRPFPDRSSDASAHA